MNSIEHQKRPEPAFDAILFVELLVIILLVFTVNSDYDNHRLPHSCEDKNKLDERGIGNDQRTITPLTQAAYTEMLRDKFDP